ncbi:MAG: ribosome maturation factor RimP [Anaerorhabdus sp.]
MDNIESIKEIILPILDNLSISLYDVKWKQQGKDKVLEISVIKKDNTIDIESCSIASEKISEKLDEEDIISYEYFLEVCSPGAEREIRNLNELSSLVNEHIYIRLNKPLKKMLEFTGDLLEVNNNEIKMNYRDKSLTKIVDIEKNNIEFCRLAVNI